MQPLFAKKPKYAKEILRQMHILNTTFVNSILKKAYITNVLINLQGLLFIFYQMNLLLKHQNGEFK